MQYPLQRGQWTTLSSKIVYQNPWITVREDAVTRPNGEAGIYGVITAPPGVGVLPIDDDGTVYLVKQYRYGIEQESLEVIVGGTEGKDAEESARRELLEETGIRADKLISLGHVNGYTSFINSPDYLFLARGLHFGDAQREGSEADMQIVKASYTQALQWVMDGTITCGISVAVILKARELVLGDKS